MTHKILIADDEPNIVISLEYLLQREGYAVVVARDGQEALEAIAREKPIPVYFIGVGEKLDELETFNAREFAQAILS